MSNHTTHRYPGKTLEEKFWLYTTTAPFTECWIWHGPSDGDEGYGRLYIGRHKHIYAHRLSYQIHNGPFPDELDICHTCDNPACVNPYHLYAGTHKNNMDDMIAKGRLVIPRLKGEASALSKLTDADVIEIRAMDKAGIPRKDVARKFGISRGTISKIVLRQRWAHIP